MFLNLFCFQLLPFTVKWYFKETAGFAVISKYLSSDWISSALNAQDH